MFVFETPINPFVEKGINYILKSQNSKGYWSLVADENRFVPYVNYYVLETLLQYLFFRRHWRDELLGNLKTKSAKPQYLTAYLLKLFYKHVEDSLQRTVYLHTVNSNILGHSMRSIQRRKDILKIITTEGEKDVAEIIDALRRLESYAYISKRSHYTQIKADMVFLKGANIVGQRGEKYFAVFSLVN